MVPTFRSPADFYSPMHMIWDIELVAMNSDKFSLGVQAGDVRSHRVTSPVYMKLRKCLRSHCINDYVADIDKFDIVLRISGSLWYFDGEGVQKIRISRKGKNITADIVVPEPKWKDLSMEDFKHYLADGVRKAIVEMCFKLEKSKFLVNKELLDRDLQLAIAEFLRPTSDLPR